MGDYQVLVYLSEADDACDAHVRPGRAPAALPERADPASRRSRAQRPRRARAVGRRPPGDARQAHRRRAGQARDRPTPITSPACAASSIDRLDRDDVVALGRIFSTIRAELDAALPDRRAADAVTALPVRLRRPRRQHRGEGRHRRLRAWWRPPSPVPAAGRVHAQPLRRPERHHQPPPPRRRPGASDRHRVQERQRGQRTGRRRRRHASVVDAVATRLGCRPDDVLDRVDRRDRPPLPDRTHARRHRGAARRPRRPDDRSRGARAS